MSYKCIIIKLKVWKPLLSSTKKGEPLIPFKKPHVHVRGHGGSIQFYILGEIKIKKDNKSLGSNKITEIRAILTENKDNFLTIWNKIKYAN